MNSFFIRSLLILWLASYAGELAAQESSPASKKFSISQLEKQVQHVLAKVKPATVAISRKRSRGNGGATGVLISSDGYILTAGHCVMNAGSEVVVLLSDGREFSATSLGFEPALDCGLIKINEESLQGASLPFAKMGWSAELKENQPCISLGHSGGFNKERGAVIRFGRIAKVVSENNGFIQSTCLMEPGDSGGPLFDMYGRVIGIHSRIDKELEKNYEVPVDLFRLFWKQLKEPKKFYANRTNTKPQFGFSLLRSRSSRASSTGKFKTGRGAKISSIIPKGWAERQKLKKYDHFKEFNNKPVQNPKQLQMFLYEAFILKLDNVKVEIMREGEKKTLLLDCSIRLGEGEKNPHLNYLSSQKKQVRSIPQLAKLPSQFKKLESPLDNYSVEINSQLNGKNQEVLGATLLKNKSGSVLIVSKSSRVGESPKITFEGKQPVLATIIKRNEKEDLILLRVKPNAVGILLARSSSPLSFKNKPQAGRFLITPHPKNKGKISLLGAGFFNTQSPGFLGVTPSTKEKNVFLKEVLPGGPADKANFKNGDVILSLDEKTVRTPQDLISILSKYKPKDPVRIIAKRDGKEFSVEMNLGSRPRGSLNPKMEGRHVADHFNGGKSKIRTGFPSILVHDAHILPKECGGPVFTTTGRFIGINIARFSRTQCYIIPAENLRLFAQEKNGATQVSQAKNGEESESLN